MMVTIATGSVLPTSPVQLIGSDCRLGEVAGGRWPNRVGLSVNNGLADGDPPEDPGVPVLTFGGVVPHAATRRQTAARALAADLSAGWWSSTGGTVPQG